MGCKYAQNAFAVGAPIRTPLGELTTLSGPLAGEEGPNYPLSTLRTSIHERVFVAMGPCLPPPRFSGLEAPLHTRIGLDCYCTAMLSSLFNVFINLYCLGNRF